MKALLLVVAVAMMVSSVMTHAGAKAGQGSNGLLLHTYNNTVLTGPPARHACFIHEGSGIIPTLDFTLPGVVSSAEVLGTVTLTKRGNYTFFCAFEGVTFAFLWIDDHLLCQVGAYGTTLGPAPNTDNPFTVLTDQTSLHVRMQVFVMAADPPAPSVSVKVLMQEANDTHPAPIHTNLLVPTIDVYEQKRRDLQLGLVRGWGSWVNTNILDIVLLPSAIRLRTEICHTPSNSCLNSTIMQAGPNVTVRVGTHAIDRSYVQYYVQWRDVNVSISYSAFGKDNADLVVLVEPISCSASVCADYQMRLVGNYAWGRAGTAATVASNQMHYEPWGLRSTDLYISSAATSQATEYEVLPPAAGAYLTIPLIEGSFGICTIPSMSIYDVRKVINSARDQEMATYKVYGNLASTKEAIQSVLMWNYIYTPTELGPIMPVSRNWNFAQNSINAEWNYVLFDWDNYFASYIAALDPRMKSICYSNIIQITKARAVLGFVPNFAAAGTKSVDRSEPAVGSRVLLELYNKFRDLWLVELLFDALWTWNTFNWEYRLLDDGLTWGSQDFDSMDNRILAQYESGMDNSPMWDCPGAAPDGSGGNCSVIFAPRLHTMLLRDVGATSIFLMDCEALAQLAVLVGRMDVAAEVISRSERVSHMIHKLWRKDIGAWSNQLLDGAWYSRMSPTAFYPLLSRSAASPEQASTIMGAWFTNRSRFCIDVSGNWPSKSNNSDACWWGLPSISYDDQSFSLGYWRGVVWAPTAQLVYWGLKNYDGVPSVQKARKHFVQQMHDMFMTQWNLNHHCCENFSPFKNATECTGDHFYHWGALAALLPFIERGYY